MRLSISIRMVCVTTAPSCARRACVSKRLERTIHRMPQCRAGSWGTPVLWNRGSTVGLARLRTLCGTTTAYNSIMTGTAKSFTSYFPLSRAPRYSVLFALPLLIVYEVLAALLAGDDGVVLRNGADVLLRSLFT